MAEECSATSAIMASNPPTPHSHGWWDMFQTASSWHHHHQHQHHQNPNSNSSNTTTCDQDDVLSISTSLTNASNHSVLTVDHDSSSAAGGGPRQLVDQPPPVAPPSSATHHLISDQHASDTHLWTQVLSSVGSNGDLRLSQDIGDNLFEAISSKATFEPACDYLKKMDTNNWEFPNPSSSPPSVFNNFVKNLNGYAAATTDHDHHHINQSSIESERLTKLSNLVSNWSIAPPDPELNHLHNFTYHHHHHIPLTNNPPSMENYSQPTSLIKNPVFLSSYNHDHSVKMEAENGTLDHMEAAPTSYFRRAFKGSNNNSNHLINSNNNPLSMEVANNLYGSSSSSSSLSSSMAAYTSRLSKPLVDIHVSNKHCFRPLMVNNLSDIHCKKQGGLQPPTSTPLQQKQMQTRGSNGRTQATANEGKKKRSGEETSSETVPKKPKQETSTASSSVKMHAPKVKLGDRITALQQIVSPFGKTDTASVLLEAIGYINFLQEQVQLLSNPYMKPNCHKDPWGSLDRKDQKGEMKVDLRSRGLCLVPISCAPQVYHDTTGSDYWTPTYRGCLYR